MHSSLRRLAHLLADSDCTELMWNGHASAFVERSGKLAEIETPFASEAEFMEVIEYLAQIASASGPVFSGILPDGSRFHVTLPPCSPYGPTLTIRKFTRSLHDLGGLLRSGFMSDKAMVFLEACVRARLNILISGATGAGKTTLLNALASAAARDERIITVEDVAEIQLPHKNWVRLIADRQVAREAVRECLVGCLRMRPDRILVGECRSSEALEMLQMMNTGHDGGMTTLHANSSVEALTRLETLVLFHAGAEIPLRALRRQIVDAIDLIVHVGRTMDGGRQLEEILEPVGMEGDVITRTTLFKRMDTQLRATGQVPSFMPRLKSGPVSLPKNFFDRDAFEVVPQRRAAG